MRRSESIDDAAAGLKVILVKSDSTGSARARETINSNEGSVALPDQSDIHEYKIMEDFCLAFEDRRAGEDLHRLIKGSGAFRRFKDAIYSMGADKAWYQFRRMEFERIAIEWLEENGIPYISGSLK